MVRQPARTRDTVLEQEAKNLAMAKRARGNVRPGQRRPIDRRPASAAAPAPAGGGTASVAPRPGGLTEAESRRAAELEAQLLAEERSVETARRQTRERAALRGESGPAGSIALRAEAEYAYVARDVKHIARIAALLFTILIGLWIIIDVAEIVPIG